MKIRKIIAIAIIVAANSLIAQQDDNQPDLFPFVLPWNDDSPSITDVSYLLNKPAGKSGYVTVGKEGHFYTGGKRIRFFGVNLSFAGGMPSHQDAPGVAGRLAKFGINVARFHHMDTGAWPNGIRDPKAKTSGELSPEALDRMDYFINELKSRGIYANINLVVGRPFNAADGLPPEIEKLDPKDRHIVGFFDAKQIELQKEYARKLLTHRNPYTKMTYTEDPVVAFVEINNEQGLIHSWLGNNVDNLPEVFLNEIKQQWNQWLKNKYGKTASLKSAWSKGEVPLGAEMLSNNTFENGLDKWILEQHSGAKALCKFVDDIPQQAKAVSPTGKALVIEVVNPGKENWHIQINQSQLKFEEGKSYTLSFWAKANKPRRISVGASQAHDPWGNMGLSINVNLSTEWKQYSLAFVANKTDNQCRVGFSSFGDAGSQISIAAVSLKPGGVYGLNEGETIEAMSIPYFTKTICGKRTKQAQLDWMTFLHNTEDNYWQSLYKFIKNDLKARALVTGTIVGCSPANIMAKMDWVDTHAYWQHPRFPGRPWDSENWIVENRTMVNERGGTLPGLALKRVYGKPHACTEYNHPAPNTFSSEGFLLLAAYASLQDWDAIYAYAYSHTRDKGWDSRKIDSFFDIVQHPTKMATVVPASTMFLREDIKPANQLVVASLPLQQEIEMLLKAHSWSLVDGSWLMPSTVSLIHRVALLTEGIKAPSRSLTPDKVSVNTNRFVSDTGELVWDLSTPGRGVVTINSPKTKAVIGYGYERVFKLGEFTIEPGKSIQNGWSAITATQVADKSKKTERWLITATGYAQNTGMKWKNPEKTSVGRDWGSPPSLVEGIPANITFVKPEAKVNVWALDEKGNRKEQLPVVSIDGNHQFSIKPQWKTLWYEIEIQ